MAGPLGAAPGIIVGVGVGTAASAVIDPLVEPGKQAAWRAHPNKILDAGLIARLVAQGAIALGDGQQDVLADGFDTDKLDALVWLAQTVPGFAQAMTVWRRQGARPNAFDDLFTHSLAKQSLDNRYVSGLQSLFDEWLTPSQVALAIVRSVMNDPGILVRDLDTSDSNVPKYTPPDLDSLTEALGGGVDKERLKVLVASIGLPPSVQQLASMYFRKIVTEGGYNQGIQQGDARPEWAPFWLEQARQILSAHDYAELRLRGWLTTDQEMYDGTAKHGMSEDDTDLLFKVLGRPIPVHQVTTGVARGGTYGGPIDTIPASYLKSMRESNVRPEWYNLDYANRYSYPSAFFFRLLLTTGALTADQAYQRFLEIGWPPDLAREIADALDPTKATGKASPYVQKADGQLWTALHKAYVKTGTDRPTVESAMTVLVDNAADREIIFERWDTERLLDTRVGPPV